MNRARSQADLRLHILARRLPNPTRPTGSASSPLTDNTSVRGVEFVRVPVMHGEMEISGYRFGNAAYLTDVSSIPESSFALLKGLEHLALSALRHQPHPNHATVEQAVSWASRIGARRTWLTHIAHELGHEKTNSMLPESVRLAHDGLTVPINVGVGQ